MAAKFTIDGEAIRQLADILVDTDLTEIEYEDDGRRIRVSRGGSLQSAMISAGPVPYPAPASAPAVQAPAPAPVPAGDHPGAVKSPMVGTAYMSSEPGSPPFVKIGDTVTAGQTLMIIEAMKVMNPIKSPRAGRILEILVMDGNPVEYGEPLMVIE